MGPSPEVIGTASDGGLLKGFLVLILAVAGLATYAYLAKRGR